MIVQWQCCISEVTLAELLMCCNLNVKSQEGLSTVELLDGILDVECHSQQTWSCRGWNHAIDKHTDFLRWEFDQDRFQADFCQDATSMNVLRTESLHAKGVAIRWGQFVAITSCDAGAITSWSRSATWWHSEFIDTIRHPFAADIRSQIGCQNNSKKNQNIQEHSRT